MAEARTPSRVWKQLTGEQRLRVAQAFWLDERSADVHAQAAMLISQAKKFRPKTVMSLDDDRKARHLASLLSLPDSVAVRALIAYHLAEQRPMMSAFLDSLGIAHDNGLIQQDHVAPDVAKIGAAAADLANRFPPDSVSLYFNTLLSQDPEAWSGLSDVPQLAAVR
jgi:hypothetical protein